MQRALAFALLARGESVLNNVSQSADCLAAASVVEALGADLHYTSKSTLHIKSKGFNPRQKFLNCGESGLAVRLFAMLAALSSTELSLSGEGSLRKRPMTFFEENMPYFGVKASSENGYLPLRITGPLQHAHVTLNGSLGSQYLTGLLIALTQVHGRSHLCIENLTSKPYLELTVAVMQDFGVKITMLPNDAFEVEGIQPFQAQSYNIEADWSGAAFWLVAAALNSNLRIIGLNLNSIQGDKAILQALELAGAMPILTANGIEVKQLEQLKAFEFDATHCPDLFPPLAALAAHCKGESRIKGCLRLVHKESNRALTLREEFAKMGVRILLNDDTMHIEPAETLIQPAQVIRFNAHNDHRIAMAMSIAAKELPFAIEGQEAVYKSYPSFFDDLNKVLIT